MGKSVFAPGKPASMSRSLGFAARRDPVNPPRMTPAEETAFWRSIPTTEIDFEASSLHPTQDIVWAEGVAYYLENGRDAHPFEWLDDAHPMSEPWNEVNRHPALVRADGALLIRQGHHRLAAAHIAGDERVDVRIWDADT